MLMMLPFEAPTIFEGIHKSYFRMPRVVKDQRSRFENDDLFRQLSHESAVKYTGFKDRPLGERQQQFITDCYLGHTEVSVVQSGNQFTLMFTPTANPAYDHEGCYIDKEQGKAHIKAGFILNGVCVLWRGWIDLQRLEGFGCLEFDEYRAYLEDAMAKQQADGKQPMCNNNLNAQAGAATVAPPPPLGRLNHHLGAPQASAPAAAAASAANNPNMLPPVGLNSSCLTAAAGGVNGAPPPMVAGLGQPPVSLAESAAAHYGNAAIAAAAAAAFHQALSAPGGVPTSLNGLHGLAGGLPGAGQPPPPPLVAPHLAYAPHAGASPPHHQHQTSPQHQQQQQQHFLSNALHQAATNGQQHTKSPERENHHHQQQQQQQPQQNSNAADGAASQGVKRQPTKRHHEEVGQTDEVDVVSDISAHELDFPPRRIFKSEQPPIASHNLHASHHKISRRAA